MVQKKLTLDAVRFFLFLLGIVQLESPYAPLRPLSKRVMREIRHAAARGGFKRWEVLESIACNQAESIERRLALVTECLDAAGPWPTYRAFLGFPGGDLFGLVPLEPGPGLRGSDVQIRIRVDSSMEVESLVVQ